MAEKAAQPAVQKKLSFKQKHALETIPGQIDGLRAKQGVLQQKLDDPDFYVKDAAGFAKTTQTYADLQAQIDKLEQEWLELEILREELEG
jgi:ATP-binding cassette subfamily F protein uup